MAILYPNESYKIIGACFEVYNELGCGFVESVYQEALAWEFFDQGIPNQPQSELRIRFKKRLLEEKFHPDFICFNTIIVELKAVSKLIDEHRASFTTISKRLATVLVCS